MFKLNYRAFFIGFILSVIFIGLLCGLALVSLHAWESGSSAYSPLVMLESGEQDITLSILGNTLYFSLNILEEYRTLLQKCTVFLPSTVRAISATWFSLFKYL